MNTSFGPWSTAITTGANQQLDTSWKRRLAMLPSLDQTVSRAARRTWLFLGAAGALALVLPTAHTVTRPRTASAAGAMTVKADSSDQGTADSVAQRAEKLTDQFKTREGSFVEYLPRPSKEERALEQPLDFEVVEMPFEECIKVFSQRAKIDVVLDYQTLTDEGVALDQPVTLTAKGGRAGSVLNRLLEPLKLATVLDDDQVKITTATSAGERLILRWYPVWDLQFTGAANSQVERSAAGELPDDLKGPPHIVSLIHFMKTAVEPDTWEDLSGPGSVVYVKEIQCVVIRQTTPVQHEILQFLRLWREAKRLERAAVAGIAAMAVGDQSRTAKPKDADNAPHKLKRNK